MKIYESAENYLETIFMLSQKLEKVRSIDIANELSLSKPSVSVAMKNFRENGLIIIDADGHITLTNSGLLIAEKVYERHTILTKILLDLGVSEDIARSDACKIEHDLSDETFEKLKAYAKTKSL